MALQIPRSVDELLESLARRPGLTGEMASRIFSVGRQVMRAFAESPPNPDEINKAVQRLERCVAAIGPEPSLHPDAAIAGELRRLAHLLQAGPPPGTPLPAASVEPPPRARLEPRPGPPRDPTPFTARARREDMPGPRPDAAPVEARPIRVAVATPAIAAAERDWYWFVLEELNGLGSLLEFQREQGDTEAATRTEQRVRLTLDTLAWDATAALKETWTFVEKRLLDVEDAWAPHLVLFALEPAGTRVQDWRAGLPSELQAAIDIPRVEIKRGTE